MKEQLISLETAQLAREKGFDWKVTAKWEPHEHGNPDLKPLLTERMGLTNYNSGSYGRSNIAAPTQSLLQKWLRDEKEIMIEIEFINFGKWIPKITLYRGKDGWAEHELKNDKTDDGYWGEYEDALEAGLVEGLKLIEA